MIPNLRKTLGALVTAGSMILSSCGTNYTAENESYLQRQKKAEEITQEALKSISSIYQNVENYLEDAEKELDEASETLKLRIKKIQELKGE